MTDKQLPQAIDIERALLGTLLAYPDSIYEIKLTPDMFYLPKHHIIFKELLNAAKDHPCDLILLTDILIKKNLINDIGGIVELTKLTDNVVSNSFIVNHSLIIKEKYLLREYIRIGNQITNISYTEDVSDVIEFAENSLFQLSDFTHSKEPRPISKSIDELLIDVEKIYKKEKSLIGIPSGYTSIDRITGGWQPSNLIIIAGRPSMGKTALALNLALNTAGLNYPVAIFSLEMMDHEIAARILSHASNYTNIEIRNADVNFDKLVMLSNTVADLPVYLDDTPALSLFELRSKVKKLILRYGVKLIIVDYLQLMKQDAGSREQEISTISRGLKAISKEFSIPVIALSQLNRMVEERSDKRPKLSDLRESGAIEQDADIVCFVYRPALYKMESINVCGNELSTEGLMLIDCAKNRNGALFSLPLYHNTGMTQINDTKIDDLTTKEPF